MEADVNKSKMNTQIGNISPQPESDNKHNPWASGSQDSSVNTQALLSNGHTEVVSSSQNDSEDPDSGLANKKSPVPDSGHFISSPQPGPSSWKSWASDSSDPMISPQPGPSTSHYTLDSSQDSLKTSCSGSSANFLFETRYVVLNFLSLLPQDLFSGHVSTSPGAGSTPGSSRSADVDFHHRFYRSKKMKKSKSLDVSPRPLLKQIGKLKSITTDYSPASEDNVSYRYSVHQQSIQDSPGEDTVDGLGGSFDKASSVPHIPLREDNSRNTKGDNSGSSSPRKTPRNFYRMASDVSSSGDLSYFEDADDEHDDFSNASSIFSQYSSHSRGERFLDLLHTHERLPTLLSESEMEATEAEDKCPFPSHTADKLEEIPEGTKSPESKYGKNSETDSFEDVSEEELKAVRLLPSDSEPEANDNHVCSGAQTESFSTRKSVGDRTKLKLDIPSRSLQLDDILLSLQSELHEELSEWEMEYEDALRRSAGLDSPLRFHTRRTPLLSPQTEAARTLARIGDEIKVQYSSQIDCAISRLGISDVKDITYDQFKYLAGDLIDQSLPGWRQVALLLVFGQHLVWRTFQYGQKELGGLVDFSSRLVADVAADFIIKQGGWGAVMNFDPSQSSDSTSLSSFDISSPGILGYFNSNDLNVTKVESNTKVDQSGSETEVDHMIQSHDSRFSHFLHQDDSLDLDLSSSTLPAATDLQASMEHVRLESSQGQSQGAFMEEMTEADDSQVSDQDGSRRVDSEETPSASDTADRQEEGRLWSYFESARRLGVKAAALSLGLVVVGIGIKLALLRR